MYHTPGCDDNGSLCPLNSALNQFWVFCCELRLDSVSWSLVITKAQLLARLNSSPSDFHCAYQFLVNFACGKPSECLLWSQRFCNEILIWSLICCLCICTLLHLSDFVFLIKSGLCNAYFLSDFLTLPLLPWTKQFEKVGYLFFNVCLYIHMK